MARIRIRTVKPELWESQKLGGCSALARLSFIGLISLADDEGRGRGSARWLFGHLHAYASDFEEKAFRDALSQLQDAGLVAFYQQDGADYYALPGWDKHQYIEKAKPSELPPVPPDHAMAPLFSTEKRDFGPGAIHHVPSASPPFPLLGGDESPQDRKGMEGIGKDGIGERSVAPSPADSTPPLLMYPCVKEPREWALTEGKVKEYQNTFPGLDVLGEARKALQWCRDNAANRKTAKGMPAFLGRWLVKAQEYGPRRAAQAPARSVGAAAPQPGKYAKYVQQ